MHGQCAIYVTSTEEDDDDDDDGDDELPIRGGIVDDDG